MSKIHGNLEIRNNKSEKHGIIVNGLSLQLFGHFRQKNTIIFYITVQNSKLKWYKKGRPISSRGCQKLIASNLPITLQLIAII